MRKSIFEYYPPQEIFENARKDIKFHFGLELTLIEQIRLRQYVKPVLEELDQISRGFLENFNPSGEVIARFMVDYYSLPVSLANYCMGNPQGFYRLFTHNWEAFKQHLKFKQEKAHLP